MLLYLQYIMLVLEILMGQFYIQYRVEFWIRE